MVAIDRSNRRIIGSSRFHGYNEHASEIEIGWTFLARSYWGGRYNGEMKQLRESFMTAQLEEREGVDALRSLDT